ncbi:NAD(P)H dehydrogenase [Mesorhizobium sp. NBSH29]|uniref:FMN-dependent NADH-azoreductase n=1 Tax=Mesorhizobium sp. NBSH29 TaxID=2654249 RepID=UPI001896474B|nr:NAD(P)H-dependent oxidoreductase [Mesorhizobium sp. NBSH29]QPC87035.1 NAD(P)H dehydrogenase [Mesorhizobium sp. NBSH29]
MTSILHIDASARPLTSVESPYGSHSRRLSARFLSRWREADSAKVIYRDVGQKPPSPVSADWIRAAFTPPELRMAWMADTLAESERLVDELLGADVIVVGVPMYNFGPPAQFKAWIDNIVRVGRTFGFDRSRSGEPYWPLLSTAGKSLIILSSRGDYGYSPGGRNASINSVEQSIASAFSYIGITDIHSIAVEYDEFADERLQLSIGEAETEVDALVEKLAAARRAKATA